MSSPFTAVIVDDEPLAVEGIRRLLKPLGSVEIVGEASDGVAGLALVERVRPQALFLDIAMPGLSGLDVAEAVKTMRTPPRIVFVTANDHHAAEAFDLSVVDYVLKPIVEERFERAVSRLADALRQNAPAAREGRFWLPHRSSMVRVSEEDIQRVEAERDYVRVIASDRSYLLRVTMADMARRLDATRFVRIHRSTIVARDRVAALKHVGAGAWAVTDADGADLSIGRTYLEGVRAALGVA